MKVSPCVVLADLFERGVDGMDGPIDRYLADEVKATLDERKLTV